MATVQYTITTAEVDLPKGGSVTAPPKKEEAIYVEPWKPWGGFYGNDYTSWFEWMRSHKSFSELCSMKAGEAIRLYEIMNGMIYEIQRRNDEVKS